MNAILEYYIDPKQNFRTENHDVVFYDIKDGRYYKTNNLSRLAKMLDLNKGHLTNLANGKMKHHKNLILWRGVVPTVVEEYFF